MRTENKSLNQIQRIDNAALGLGEAGEVQNIVKKYFYHGKSHEYMIDRVQDELGDVLWYVAQMCDALEITMDSVAEANIRKLHERWPQGFQQENSNG